MYLQQHAVPEHQTLTQLWIQGTAPLIYLSKRVMDSALIDRVIRINHSQKLCKKVKLFTDNGKKEGLKELRMLLLVQNEAGQIVGRSFASSENYHQTESMLRNKVQERIAASAEKRSQPIILVSDNATAVRAMAHRVFGDDVAVKQDPFHIIQRLSEKVRDRGPRKLVTRFICCFVRHTR